jgi:hypothetical protein
VTRTVTLVAGLVLALSTLAEAEHEVYFRYVILGYITDSRGLPVSGRTVTVVRDKTGLGYRDETDAQGLYVIVVRLGDESAGETLTVRAGDAITRVTARFDPTNHQDDRGTRMDLEGAQFTERAASFRPTLANVRAAPAR